MKTIKPILIVLWLCIFADVRAQSVIPNLPQVIPVSPAVANFMRYSEIPVDYSTGVPGISIPLYTAKSRQLTVPISIAYHASGIKVEDKASVIGLGWVLNAGGYVGLTQMGGGGENSRYQSLYYHSTAEFDHQRDSAAALGLDAFRNFGTTIGFQNAAPVGSSNRYTFQLPGGESGVFRYDYRTGQLINLPYSNIKIQKLINPGSNDITGLVITDEKGVVYTFTLPANANASTVNSFNWDLTRIVSADKTDTIRFVYKSQQNIYNNYSFFSSVDCGPYPVAAPPNNTTTFNHYTATNGISAVNAAIESIPDSIITSTAVIKFTVANDRMDKGLSIDPYRITNMSVYSRVLGKLIKSFTFDNNHYFGSTANNFRLELQGLLVSGSDNVAVEKYGFAYQAGELPAYPETLIGSATPYAEDYWGYACGAGAALVPYQFIPEVVDWGGPTPMYKQSYMGMDRTPQPDLANAAMLTEIDYPTGGKTVFTFEPNYAVQPYWNSGLSESAVVGGFRIKQIRNYKDGATLSDYKTYTYGAGHTRQINQDLYRYVYRVEGIVESPLAGLQYIIPNRQVINSNPFLPLTADNGPPVFYDSVTEYNGDTNGNTGKTVYSYVTPPAAPLSTYATPNDLPIFRDGLQLDRGNYIPRLDSKTDYKYTPGGYVPVKKVHQIYASFLADRQNFTGIHSTLTTEYPQGATDWYWDFIWCGIAVGSGQPVTICLDPSATLQYPYYYYLTDLHSTQETFLPMQTINYDFNLADSTKFVANTTSYTYNNAVSSANLIHLQPTSKTVSSSTGDTYLTSLKYPSDMPGAPYPNMLASNMLYPVVQQLTYKNTTGNFLNAVTTSYYQWTANLIAPQTVQIQKGTNPLDTVITYHSYDAAANITSVSKTHGSPVSYVWGYRHTYPIAMVTGAPAQDIFYDGFEEGDGNSTKEDSKTGHYSNVLGINKFLTNLDDGSYRLTYWQRASGSSVWSLHTSVVNVTGGNYQIVIVGQIDDVRFYPLTAQMTTYTYEPAVGQTSVTDAKNQVTYYSYDTFNRLQYIKDKDNNVVKYFCYNYKDQGVGCILPDTAVVIPPPPPVTPPPVDPPPVDPPPVTPPPPVISYVYIRLEQTNYTSSTPVTNGQGGTDDQVTADLSIHFYSDAACSVPYTLTVANTLQVLVSESAYQDMLGTYTPLSYIDTYTISAGTSSYPIGTQTLKTDHSYFSDSVNEWYDNIQYNYGVIQPADSTYILIN
jgi:hypothetical protein